MIGNFDKKIDQKCDVCGRTLTQFGSKRLKDGWCCRTCIKVASPWLQDEDYAEKSIENMKKHISYRKDNMKLLDELKFNPIIDNRYTLYIDQDEKYFLISRKKNWTLENPDILKLKDIAEISITEESYLGDDEDGVDLFFNIKLDAGEIKNVRFRVNEFPNIEVDSDDYNKSLLLADKYLEALKCADKNELD